MPWITLTGAGSWAFIITGALGFLWLALWFASTARRASIRRLSAAELAYIESDPIEAVTPVPWRRLLPHRQTWAFAVGKFLTDPVWWLYLYWVPDFLHRAHHIDLKGSALPIFVIYQIATIGSVAGGWLPARLLANAAGALNARAQDRDARAGRVRAADRASRRSSRTSGLAVLLIGIAAVGAPGLVGESLHVLVGHVPQARRRIGRRASAAWRGAVGGMFIALVVGKVLQHDRQLRPRSS